MVYYKQVELKDATAKYGFENKSIFAKEPIKRGEKIFACEPSTCDLLQLDDVKSVERPAGKTSADIKQLLLDYPHLKDFIIKYMYMIDDDTFDLPKSFPKEFQKDLKEPQLLGDCIFYNHSCDPNCAYLSLDTYTAVAIRDIECGEEMTFDYQNFETEASFDAGLVCKCGSFNCRGVLLFDQYRNIDWQIKYSKYCLPFMQRKIDELKTKWYSSRCFLKYYINEDQKRGLGLTSLKMIAKHDMVALFFDLNNISTESHYIRHSENPTCYLLDNKVYASNDIDPLIELTINFNLVKI